MSLETHEHYGAVCGEVQCATGDGWVVSAQMWESKVAHILDAALETVCGYVNTMPENFTMYRYKAIRPRHGHQVGSGSGSGGSTDGGADQRQLAVIAALEHPGPLTEYFRPLTSAVEEDPEKVARLVHYHAPQKVLLTELLTTPHASWQTAYVRNAKAIADVPKDLGELVEKECRHHNRRIFAMLYLFAKFERLWEHSSHSLARKCSLLFLQSFDALHFLLEWFSLALFFVTYFHITVLIDPPCGNVQQDVNYSCSDGQFFGIYNATFTIDSVCNPNGFSMQLYKNGPGGIIANDSPDAKKVICPKSKCGREVVDSWFCRKYYWPKDGKDTYTGEPNYNDTVMKASFNDTTPDEWALQRLYRFAPLPTCKGSYRTEFYDCCGYWSGMGGNGAANGIGPHAPSTCSQALNITLIYNQSTMGGGMNLPEYYLQTHSAWAWGFNQPESMTQIKQFDGLTADGAKHKFKYYQPMIHSQNCTDKPNVFTHRMQPVIAAPDADINHYWWANRSFCVMNTTWNGMDREKCSTPGR
jgi:hypothetical protein